MNCRLFNQHLLLIILVGAICSVKRVTLNQESFAQKTPTKALADIVINSGMNDVAFDLIKSKISLLL